VTLANDLDHMMSLSCIFETDNYTANAHTKVLLVQSDWLMLLTTAA